MRAVSGGTTEAGEPTVVDLAVLESVQRRVLWLATRIIDAANHDRPHADGLKVGGHQASSASLVSVMTALWFAHLDGPDRVSVKPHASPVFHAIQYLIGNLDRSYLTSLRSRGGLQSYPSRTKDPDREYVDFSTGSVGLGAAAPLFAAATRRYLDAHFPPRPPARFISLLGDAELDEGNIWEAIADPATVGLGNVTWIVDFNRQSLDRVVPGVRIAQWRGQFEAAGWHVIEVKYGRRLRQAFDSPHGPALRSWLDAMDNEQYQSLFGMSGKRMRDHFLDGAPDVVGDAIAGVTDIELADLLTDLGGHDLCCLLEAYAAADAITDRPTVIFAYTIKGWGLSIAGNPRNHSALLRPEDVEALRGQVGLTAQTEWDRFDPASPEGILAGHRREILRREPRGQTLDVAVPVATSQRVPAVVSTQETFGRILVDLSRQPDLAKYLVTTAPDVATSTNLAGFINRMGVFSPTSRRDWSPDGALKWVEGPQGQHIELGISEMNLFLLLGQLGLAGELSGQPLIPVGTVYDPFVCRGLDAFIYSVYSGAQFIVAGTPSGISLAPEGGAHQSTVTASIGIELPNTTLIEPAYGVALDWLLCDAIAKIAGGRRADSADTPIAAEPRSYYFRLTTRPIEQAPFEAARARLGDAVLRRLVLSGAYQLSIAPDLPGAPSVYLAACGAVLPEVLIAAAELRDEGIAAHVVDVTSADRLYTAWQRTLRHGVRTATTPSVPGALRAAFPTRAPVVSVHDAASHALSWLGSALGVACVPLGVDSFGQSGTIDELYEIHDLSAGSIVNAALAALTLS